MVEPGRHDDERRPDEVAWTRRTGMTRYLISFDDGAMDFPEEELCATCA